MKARDLQEGHVLVDPDGHLYEVTAVVKNLPDAVHVWLWPDSSPVPNYFQTFKSDEDIVGISVAGPPPESSTEETTVIPRIEEDTDGPDANGVAE